MSPRCETCGHALPDASGVVVDVESGMVSREGMTVRLTVNQMNMFAAIYRASGRTIRTDALCGAIWPNPSDEPENPDGCIKTMLCRVRRFVRPLGILIHTDFARGYSLSIVRPVRRAA